MSSKPKSANPAAAHDEMPEVPVISRVAGAALQQAVDEVNRAFVNLLRTAALLGPSEPLAPSLIGVSQEVIDKFSESRVVDRMLDMSFGFPLVKARILDHHLIDHMVNSGSGDARAIQAITESFSLDVISRATAKRRLT